MIRYYTGTLWKHEKPDSLISVLSIPNVYDFKLDGFKSIIDFYDYKKDKEKSNEYLKLYSDFIFENKEIYEGVKMNSFLDRYSWSMTEINQNLDMMR